MAADCLCCRGSDLARCRWLLGRRSEAAGQEAESSEEAAAAMGGASPQVCTMLSCLF